MWPTSRMKRLVMGAIVVVTASFAGTALAQSQGQPGALLRSARRIPKPHGIYVVNEASNGQTSHPYATGLTSSPAYQDDVDGHAIFLPLARILPTVTVWGQFAWDWTYLDSLVNVAVANGKKFSVELEIGYQNLSNCGPNQDQPCYLYSLTEGFVAACGADCAPLFDVWTLAGTCITAYVPLPWNTNVQQLWVEAAAALSAHLKQTGTARYLRLVHIPGVSIYDEELRLPTGFPRPSATDTTVCPDGRLAYPSVIDDASQTRWQGLGYSDTAVIAGFTTIAAAYAKAFPRRYLGLSLLNPGAIGIDFPNYTSDPVGYVASQLVREATMLAPGRVQLQSDDLDTDRILTEVVEFADLYNTRVGWQTNKRGGTGAACFDTSTGTEGPCVDLGQTGVPYFDIVQEGALNSGKYLEVWSADVVQYPQSFSDARAAGYFP